MAANVEDAALAMPDNNSTRRPTERRRHPHSNPREGMMDMELRNKGRSPVEREKAAAQLGQYKIIRTLGEGSFGKVKLAVHQQTKQQVAFKIINRKKLVTRDMAGRIEREIKYLSLLRHPHIIKL
jgi:carbon catabolite-derepressing protein kinase